MREVLLTPKEVLPVNAEEWSNVTGDRLSLPKKLFVQPTREESAEERERHERALRALFALRRLVHARQNNSLTLGGSRGSDIIRQYFSAFQTKLLIPFVGILRSVRIACGALAGNISDFNLLGSLGLAIAFAVALPLMLLPLVLAGVIMLVAAPIFGLVCLVVLVSVAEWNSALIATLMTLNPWALWSLYVLRLCTFVGTAKGLDYVPGVETASEADALATQLKTSYEASSVSKMPDGGGYMTHAVSTLIARWTGKGRAASHLSLGLPLSP